MSKLPLDITEEEIGSKKLSYHYFVMFTSSSCWLDILFSVSGKIKKIKIYSDRAGNKKGYSPVVEPKLSLLLLWLCIRVGDALVTYMKHESVLAACIQLNNLNIGDGHIMQVTKAEFKGENSQVRSYIVLACWVMPLSMMNGCRLPKNLLHPTLSPFINCRKTPILITYIHSLCHRIGYLFFLTIVKLINIPSSCFNIFTTRIKL